MISPDPSLGFIPSPVKIEKIRAYRKHRKSKAESVGTKDKKGEKSRTPYEVVPNVRHQFSMFKRSSPVLHDITFEKLYKGPLSWLDQA